MRLLNYPAPTDYAPGGTTKRIYDIMAGLKRTGGCFAGLTPVQKQKATKLLKHNAFDVKAMTLLLRQILNDEEKFVEKFVLNIKD